MPNAFRDLFVDWTNKGLLQSELGGEFILPAFFKYEGIPYRVSIMTPDYSEIPPGYSKVDIANMALRITVNSTLDDASPEAERQTWDKDSANNWFTGELSLNTAAIASLVGSATSVTAYFQIQVSESGGDWRTIYQTQITIKNSVTQPTTVSPDPVTVYYTKAEADGLFLTGKNRPGVQIGTVSPNGLHVRWLGVDDNGTRVDDVEDNIS